MGKGFASSEFWLHIAALVGPAVLQALSGSGDPTLVVVAQLAACIYTAARTLLKHQDGQLAAPPAPPAAK